MLRRFTLVALSIIISAFIPSINTQYPLTYGAVGPIVAYMPMNKLVNFVNNLNKDATLAAKKNRAASFIPANIGTHKFKALDIYSAPAKAVTAVQSLVTHRDTVGTLWNDLTPRLTSVFNAATAKTYKAMWAKTDKVYDNAFFDALNQWYAYCHYHSPAGKRTALYNAIQATTSKFVNNTSLNYDAFGGSYQLSFFLTMILGAW